MKNKILYNLVHFILILFVASCVQQNSMLQTQKSTFSAQLSNLKINRQLAQMTSAKPSETEKKCLECHQPIIQNKFSHFPAQAGLCSTCHTVSAKHLEDGKDPVQTKDTAADCFRCHTQNDTGKVVHGALSYDQSCIACHNPHGGDKRFFIKAESVKELCIMCHTAPEGTDLKTKHGPVEDQRSCTNCHNPHSSDNDKMLKLPSKDLCLSCHDKEIQATISDTRIIPNIKKKVEEAASQHTGAIMGDCTTCHNPHGSKYNRILLSNYSISNYNNYSAKGENPYALCFTCHDPNMLDQKNFVDKTGFRIKNKKNMHWEHVVNANGQDPSLGRSCKICHDPHGSEQDFHINESWNMKGNQIDIKYTKTDNGGQCTFTCHDVKIYNRD